MSNQYEIELIHAANRECDRLQAKIDELEKKNRALENYKNQSYRIKNQRHEISNRLKGNQKLREILAHCYNMFRIEEVTSKILHLPENKDVTWIIEEIRKTIGNYLPSSEEQESEVPDETC